MNQTMFVDTCTCVLTPHRVALGYEAPKECSRAPSSHLKDSQREGVCQLFLVLQNYLPVPAIDVNAGDGVELGVDPVEAATGKI